MVWVLMVYLEANYRVLFAFMLPVTSMLIAVGFVSAISETSAEFGGALGIALLGSLVTFLYRNSMTATDAPASAKLTLNDAAITAGANMPPGLETAREAFSNAYAINCAIAALGTMALALVAKRVLG